MVVILAVVGGVLIIHVILEIIANRYRLWKRYRNQQQSTSVRYVASSKTRSVQVEEGSDEESDAQETSRLIFFDNSKDDITTASHRDHTIQDARVVSQSESHSTMEDGACRDGIESSLTEEMYRGHDDQDSVNDESSRCEVTTTSRVVSDFIIYEHES